MSQSNDLKKPAAPHQTDQPPKERKRSGTKLECDEQSSRKRNRHYKHVRSRSRHSSPHRYSSKLTRSKSTASGRHSRIKSGRSDCHTHHHHHYNNNTKKHPLDRVDYQSKDFSDDYSNDFSDVYSNDDSDDNHPRHKISRSHTHNQVRARSKRKRNERKPSGSPSSWMIESDESSESDESDESSDDSEFKEDYEHISKKTKSKRICSFFLKGKCTRGALCAFRHERDAKAKHRPACAFYWKGLCKKGSTCKFRHYSAEPCFFFHHNRFFGSAQKCEKGLGCTFSHAPITREQFENYVVKGKAKKREKVDSLLGTRLTSLEGLLKNSQTAVKTLQETQEKLLAQKTTVCWEWQNENSHWVAYERAVQGQLEVSYKAQQPFATVKPTKLKFSYKIDLKNMEQVNEQTATKRKVRRTLVSKNDHHPNSAVLKRFQLEDATKVKQFTEDAHVAGGPNHTVSSVLAVLRDDVDYQPPVDSKDEKIMFHATSIEVCVKIQQGAFIPSAGGMLGAGIYLAPSPQKSWGYRKGNINCMLLCLVNTNDAATRGTGTMLEYCVKSPRKCSPLYIVIFD